MENAGIPDIQHKGFSRKRQLVPLVRAKSMSSWSQRSANNTLKQGEWGGERSQPPTLIILQDFGYNEKKKLKMV